MEMFTSFKKVMADPEITTAGKSVFLNLLSRMDKKWENNLPIDTI